MFIDHTSPLTVNPESFLPNSQASYSFIVKELTSDEEIENHSKVILKSGKCGGKTRTQGI